MTNRQQRNVFAGATEEQLERIKKRDDIERQYMKFIDDNPNLKMEEYMDKYKELTKVF